MTFQFDDNPEDLVRLRDTVKEWLKKSVTSVFSFDDLKNGVFKLTSDDTKNNTDDFSLTTNARCYMALVNAFRFLDDKKRFGELETKFFDFLIKLYSSDKNIGSDIKNNFKLAHFMDLVFVEQFLRKYHNGEEESKLEDRILIYIKNKIDVEKGKSKKEKLEKLKKWLSATKDGDNNGSKVNGSENIISVLCQRIENCHHNTEEGNSLILAFLNELAAGEFDPLNELKKLLGNLDASDSKEKKEIIKLFKKYSDTQKAKDSSKSNSESGDVGYQLKFLEGDSGSRHFFVTLHVLRAISIISPGKPCATEFAEKCAKHAEKFCREQISYRHGKKHCQDIFRLVFAITIYVLYEKHADKSLIQEILEIISETQLSSGNWPSTHPISRTNKKPWYITTHEIPLCLTWLYFQPRVPDVARPHLFLMMEKYFNGWVIPTYRRIGKYKGWFDEGLNGKDEVTGWATGVVCHFLANYCAVLNDHINRRVIETLNLQSCSDRYLIDETTLDFNPKWKNCYGDDKDSKRPIWSDLQPYIWYLKDEKEIAKTIQWKWTDPTDEAELSKKLAEYVIFQILTDRQSRPDNYVAGVLDGPPGTRKTSLVKTLSKILKWPLISVPASVIFENGFDKAETQASRVFRMLNYLTGCIIFFDEFEEFMRARLDNAIIHDRTIAAFMTSAMLPRFQDLHDKKYCLIFLATNHPDKIDDAIIRPGRFDFKETIDYPNISRFIAKNPYLDVKNLSEITLNKMCCETNDTKWTIKKPKDKERIKVIVVAVKKAFGSIKERKTIKFGVVEAVLLDVNKWYMDEEKKGISKTKIKEMIEDKSEKILLKEITSSDEKGHGPQRLPPL